MVDTVPDGTWALIIDTEQYAGNFEREMTAFLTGHVGECGVGEERVEEMAKDRPAFENVIDISDDRGCRRPCSRWPTPGWHNDGHGEYIKGDKGKYAAFLSVAIFFDSHPKLEQIKWIKSHAVDFNPEFGEKLTITGFRLIRVEKNEIQYAI